ncbi:hypothetical protein TNCV_3848641 [Trichonephila clavipes]|uniref:Uncharacterized protein n=1 Tax=Trichonephila clavipes TaxID=2585209 RepID=A0A8X6RCW9_TRICX|nr:hypothetical protein TNCV_3848641 [Trichonephila clavipes]
MLRPVVTLLNEIKANCTPEKTSIGLQYLIPMPHDIHNCLFRRHNDVCVHRTGCRTRSSTSIKVDFSEMKVPSDSVGPVPKMTSPDREPLGFLLFRILGGGGEEIFFQVYLLDDR